MAQAHDTHDTHDTHGSDDLKYVGIVAAIIGGVVLLLGLLGVLVTFL